MPDGFLASSAAQAAGLAASLAWPLARLVLSVSLGLLVATLIESLSWTHGVARLAAPVFRLGRLRDISGASFSLAFFSSAGANTLLAEAHERGDLTRRELVLSNLFNSLPTYFLHLPSMLALTWSVIGHTALVYVGLTLLAAVLRTAAIVLYGRLTLPPLPEGCVACRLEEARAPDLRAVLAKALRRFRSRLRRVLLFTVPIYVCIAFMTAQGIFAWIERWLAGQVGLLSWLDPQAMSIVVFNLAGESTGGLAAAAALLHAEAIPRKDVVLALLVGVVLASPMRGLRTQYPYYAGIFKPALALNLVVMSQAVRVASIVLVGLAYYLVA
jgi:hypothetical protein